MTHKTAVALTATATLLAGVLSLGEARELPRDAPLAVADVKQAPLDATPRVAPTGAAIVQMKAFHEVAQKRMLLHGPVAPASTGLALPLPASIGLQTIPIRPNF